MVNAMVLGFSVQDKSAFFGGIGMIDISPAHRKHQYQSELSHARCQEAGYPLKHPRQGNRTDSNTRLKVRTSSTRFSLCADILDEWCP